MSDTRTCNRCGRTIGWDDDHYEVMPAEGTAPYDKLKTSHEFGQAARHLCVSCFDEVLA